MDALWRDLRYAVRTLVRAPTFTVVAVLTLALGIGANTAVFSVVDGVLLRDLPYDRPEELVTVWLDTSRRDGPVREWFTPQDLLDYRAEEGLFEEIGGWGGYGPTLTGLGEPEVLAAAVVTEGMFEGVLHARPFLGRDFLSEEDEPGAAGSVLLSYAFWRERFGGDRSVLGRSVLLDERPYRVVGVMPEGFRPPFVPRAELWTPARLDPTRCGRGCYTIRTVARLAAGESLELARARGGALAARLEAAYPNTNGKVGVAIFGLREDMVRPAARALWILLGAVAFVLLIACTNVANLMLARAAARRGEFSVRVALGAGSAPIFRQLLTESAVLALLGGVVGLLFATWGTDLLVSLAPVSLPGVDEVGLDGPVLAFTGAVTLGTGLLFGLLPALRAGRSELYTGVRGGYDGDRVGARVRGALIVGQVAIALVLLVGAGLLTRSFQRLNDADLGFDPEGVLAVRLALPAERFADRGVRIGYYEELLARMEAIPGVASVGGTTALPLAGNDGDSDFRIEHEPPPDPTQANVAWIRQVTAGYFQTIGLRLLEGREFDTGDAAGAPRVVIVNEALARRYFDYPRRNPIGTRVTFGDPDAADAVWRTIVGIARNTRHFSVRDGTRPAMYFPYDQEPARAMSLIVRTDGDPVDLSDDVRSAITSIDPTLAASSFTPLASLVDASLETDRFVTTVLGLFAALALILAAVGLYGVVSFGVTRRMREMGIRLALGAEGVDVRRLVVTGGVRLALLGVGFGLAGSLLVTGVLDSLLYDVAVTDPVTFVGMAGVLTAVALLASWLPARRASRADPVAVLREE